MRKAKFGTCRLTNHNGQFVRCHLLPQALTRQKHSKGERFIEAGMGDRAIGCRWNSWYDDELVCAEGEACLEKYDDKGIKELRLKKLVWNGWGADEMHLNDKIKSSNSAHLGLRKIVDVNGEDLRWFFLSLLWRAAVTERTEFREISLPDEHVEELRQALISHEMPPQTFYPMTLLQYSTRGGHHNRSPICWRGLPPSKEVPYVPQFKFYMDGLAVLIFSSLNELPPGLGDIIVGVESHLVVLTMNFEHSEQFENLLLAVRDAHAQGIR